MSITNVSRVLRVRKFEQTLLDFYKLHGRRNLPWRKSSISPYEVWVSEIMLQQTQVSRVIVYYERFLKRFPTIFHLARASWEKFLPYYAGLGYYRRGRNMLATARIIVNDFGGEFPREKKLLCKLPGIGEYTAAAILSFAFGEQYLAFDTNLQKVFGRYFFGNRHAVFNRTLLDKALRADRHILNAAIMDFANSVCLNAPRCPECPLVRQCRYAQEQGKRERTRSRETLETRGVSAISTQNSRRRHRSAVHSATKFPMKQAQVFLWLHREHKEYYSLNPDTFEVFVLPAPLNTREKIKAYFRKEYNLEISVRPPHQKIYVGGKPTLVVNAQILFGEHEFAVYSKAEARPVGSHA
ncbi:MAG: hypothetical protein A3B74_00895 [Candidatus Kerfeldbacteria bacterium RIFCSPHIGHO2_02_FULL_42_14]|uniref:Adenine DNA glycosylase n=1 Tax=Candidatus Kerfeldbacteria bacterium RIFCSPHIGHO2_02_FULL_42_14 TaxID=1798540 RepID=A0A1G2AR48_9BACT|nr:MAG: hypothetical protein A3B74_00895 [Candidatus Kerfeldbacteria bacterium RIFCSPHIGHO2_02_FULL_42_14]OGY83455.1 MAG: hypothetical protein A3I91_02280 [Candidatus Kerfeldbacteria bacterium RIFCSPLOWO2_02_FULL_42_19]OGY87019.1 MAG: hypothetical protein A3G01_01930 [Candidatus Kerfeldbacteria bacterium RIFCSPLOWO2_12_FULL_43_9]